MFFQRLTPRRDTEADWTAVREHAAREREVPAEPRLAGRLALAPCAAELRATVWGTQA